MTVDARLGKLYAKLSARERAQLAFESIRSKQPEPPEIRKTMPPSQAKEFHYYLRLLMGFNGRLWTFICVLTQKADKLLSKHELKLTRAMLRLATAPPEDLEQPDRFDTLVSGTPSYEWLMADFMLGVSVSSGVGDLWRDLRTIDILTAEVAEEVGVEDPLLDLARSGLDDIVRVQFEFLKGLLGDKASLEEPDSDSIDLTRRTLRQDVV